MGDMDWPSLTKPLEIGRVKVGIVVIRDTFAKVRDQRIPHPFLAAVLSPLIKCGFTAGYPGKVV